MCDGVGFAYGRLMQSSLLALFGLVFVASSSMVACAASSDDDSPATEGTANGADEEVKAAVIGESQNKKTVDVQLGRSFNIALESNGSTGYSWSVKGESDLGKPKQSTIPGDASRPGAPGTQKFSFSTKGASVGAHTIKLEYQRPWAELSPPAKTFEVTINVTDATKAKKCGGFVGFTCAATEYCEFPAAAACGMADQQGTCTAKGDFCPQFISTVCGCDGKEYGNGCFANAAGASVAHQGACTKN